MGDFEGIEGDPALPVRQRRQYQRALNEISCRSHGAPLQESNFWRTQTLRYRHRSSPWL